MTNVCLQKNADCQKILLCAPSNAAVDELCRKLKQRNGLYLIFPLLCENHALYSRCLHKFLFIQAYTCTVFGVLVSYLHILCWRSWPDFQTSWDDHKKSVGK